jgi:SAM-dependent methyltransferase
MKEPASDLTPLYSRHLLRLMRPFPDFDVVAVKPLRRKAARLLQLKLGDRVVDAGCGMGGSFPYLVDSVGPTGEVVGIEISPEAAINARLRISKNGWRNVQVIEASAQTAVLTGTFDGLLMFAAPDVYASEEALANILPHLGKGARIVFFGAKTSVTPVGRILNPFFRWTLSRLSFPSTPAPDPEPWRLVGRHVEGLEIEDRLFGSMFLASGTCVGGR